MVSETVPTKYNNWLLANVLVTSHYEYMSLVCVHGTSNARYMPRHSRWTANALHCHYCLFNQPPHILATTATWVLPYLDNNSFQAIFISVLQHSYNTQIVHTEQMTSCQLIDYMQLRVNLPSDPMTKWWRSGPDDIRGTRQFFSRLPRAVTILMWTTYSHHGIRC